MNQDDAHIRDQLSAYLDGELSVEDRAAVEAALAAHPELQAELDRMRRVDDLYQKLPVMTAPEILEENVLQALTQKQVVHFRPEKRPPWRVWIPVAAAATVLLLVGVPWMMQGGPFVENKSMLLSQSMEKSVPEEMTDGAGRRGGGNVKNHVGSYDQAASGEDSSTITSTGAPSIHPPLPLETIRPKAEEAPQRSRQESADANEYRGRGEDDGGRRGGSSRTGVAAKPPRTPTRAAPATASAPAPKPVVAAPPVQSDSVALSEEPEAEAVPEKEIAENITLGGRRSPSAKVNVHTDAMSSTARSLANRSFQRVGDTWQQAGYTGESLTLLQADSAAYKTLLEEHPELTALKELSPPILFQVEKTWYRLETKEDVGNR